MGNLSTFCCELKIALKNRKVYSLKMITVLYIQTIQKNLGGGEFRHLAINLDSRYNCNKGNLENNTKDHGYKVIADFLVVKLITVNLVTNFSPELRLN